MNEDLGKPIAYGRTAEIYAWHQGQVLKLFYDWVGLESIEKEMQHARVIYDSGLPIPQVGEIIHMNKRIGLIYQRIYGESLYKLAQRKPWNIPHYFKRTAELHFEIHSCSISAELPSQRETLEKSINQAAALPNHLRSKALAVLEAMPDGKQLCHGDFWGGNVLMTSQGEVIIDWHRSSRGNPLADVARTTNAHLGFVQTKQIKRAFLSYGETKISQVKNSLLQLIIRICYPFYLNRYYELYPGVEDEYRRWLPIVAAARLADNIPEFEKMLIEQVESSL